MFINNKQTRPVCVNSPSGLLVLRPGVNEIADADYPMVKEALTNAQLFKLDHMVEGPVKEVKEGGKTAFVGKSLAECSAPQAEALIAETFDEDLLKAWKKAEKRDDIRVAIANQLEIVKAGPQGAEDKE